MHLRRMERERGLYKEHDLAKQQSIAFKGQHAIKPAQTANPLTSPFPDTVVTHIFPITHTIITCEP